MLGIALLAVGGASIGVVVFAIVQAGLDRVEKAWQRRRKQISLRREARDRLPRVLQKILEKQHGVERPPWAQAWLDYASPRLERAGFKVAPLVYLGIMAGAAVAGFIVGAAVLNNPLAGALIAVIAVLVPEQAVSRSIEAGRSKLVSQLGLAVQMFGAELAEKQNVQTALAVTASRMPEPLKGILKQSALDLQAGMNPGQVFGELAARLDFDYGRLFAQLLLAATDNPAITPLFPRLATRIAGYQTLHEKNRSELAWLRLVGVLLNALVVPAIVVISLLVPSVGAFLLREPAGKLIVVVGLLSIVVGLVLDRSLNQLSF